MAAPRKTSAPPEPVASPVPVIPPAPPSHIVQLLLNSVPEGTDRRIELRMTDDTIRRLLRHEMPFIPLPDGPHPYGQTRFLSAYAVQEIAILGPWEG
jgi:hypothetical protein